MTALKNACHWSATALKERVASDLTWPRIVSLARDPADPAMQEETFGLLRNLACTAETDIALVITHVGEAMLFEIVSGALWSTRKGTMLNVRMPMRDAELRDAGARHPAQHRSRRPRELATCNLVSAASDASAVCASGASHEHASLLTCQAHSLSEVRLTAVWVVENILRREPGSSNPRRACRRSDDADARWHYRARPDFAQAWLRITAARHGRRRIARSGPFTRRYVDAFDVSQRERVGIVLEHFASASL